ncbi:HNH endonuclease [Variovorax paradoxus]|nr:HNH endonuclease [Variovorax paradoxus]MBT2300419.1 HNH endonuclease [Variovorax paradoxus]
MAITDITAEEVRARLDYDPETGVFTWKGPIWKHSHLVGQPAGTKTKHGYIQIGGFGRKHRLLAHRLAFIWMNGEWPKGVIDHRDGDGCNNRWGNLREGDTALNAQNRQRAVAGSVSGLLGVSWHQTTGKWVAAIKHAGTSYTIGKYDDKHEAHAAYLQRKRELHAFNTL